MLEINTHGLHFNVPCDRNPVHSCTLHMFSSSRKVVFALIETWPWAREELEREMAKQATEDLEDNEARA